MTDAIAFLLTLALLLLPVGILAGIIFVVKARRSLISDEKKHNKRWAWFSFLGPIALILLLAIVQAVTRLATNTMQ